MKQQRRRTRSRKEEQEEVPPQHGQLPQPHHHFDLHPPAHSKMAAKHLAGWSHASILKYLEELCSKREEVTRQIEHEEEEKQLLQRQICILADKLERVSETLARRYNVLVSFDRTISETQEAYAKILERMQCALTFMKRETANISEATESSEEQQPQPPPPPPPPTHTLYTPDLRR